MMMRRPPTGTSSFTAVLAMLMSSLSSSCEPLTELVLVVDTDMTVPADLDQVSISVEGAGGKLIRRVDVDVEPPSGVGFPLTLGLKGGGGSKVVTVTASATSQSSPVVTQKVRTEFVPGESRMLRLTLSTACLPVRCLDDQTCESGSCQAVDRPRGNLPPWGGVLPDRPTRPVTVPVVGQTVWGSGWHSAAVEGTTLYAWGENSDGQLGTGTTQNAKTRRPVLGVQAPLSVGLGQRHSCVCDRQHRAFCWGRNIEGQLGTGNTMGHLTATPVPGIEDCFQIAGAGSHTCAIRTGGAVSCWGSNGSGQVGQPGGGVVLVPTAVAGLAGIVQIGGGDGFTCALRSDKVVLCWGDNNAGQLGDGTTVDRFRPMEVSGLANVAELSVGRTHSCARHMDGTLSCWGDNSAGQLGNGSDEQTRVPVAVAGLAEASHVAAGHLHSCALSKASQTVFCWGSNASGQLGAGTSVDGSGSEQPVLVSGLYEATSIAAGSAHTCARHNNRAALSCWGDNFVNQLGDGSTVSRRQPVSVAGF